MNYEGRKRYYKHDFHKVLTRKSKDINYGRREWQEGFDVGVGAEWYCNTGETESVWSRRKQLHKSQLIV